jgi:NAD(P)-dependent dehydrogenase (short-subunit alcohol dehydrogenase family)
MDVSNKEQVESGMARVIEAFGRLDILISNAGGQIVASLVEFEFKMEEAAFHPLGCGLSDDPCRPTADV